MAVTTQNRAMCGAHALATQEGGEWKPQVQLFVRQSAAISRDRDAHSVLEWAVLACTGVEWDGVGCALECVRLRKQKQIDKQTMQPLPAASRLNWPEGAQEKAHSALSNLKMIKAGWPAGSRQHTVIQHSSNELVSRNTAYATLREGRVVELVAHSSLSVTWQDEL